MMTSRSILAAAAALLGLAGCSDNNVETQKADKGAKVSISIDGTETENAAAMADASADVNIAADSETGKVEIKLPGGLEAKVDMPEGAARNTKFDIHGVGLYPGARVGSIKVEASGKSANGGKGDNATVNIGFSAPADAAVVADWYEQQFDAKRVAVRRSGETLSGKTDDGDDFVLALNPAAAGSSGLLTIRETN